MTWVSLAMPGIAGFGAAAEVVGGARDSSRLARLRDRVERGVRELAPATRIFGSGVPRLANTSCFAMSGVASETLVMALDLAGVPHKKGGVQVAMGHFTDDARGAIKAAAE